MMQIYLWTNAVLYAVFAVWCAIRLDDTARAIGYQALSAGGRSEYLTVYGGLQLGLAIFFAWTALRPEMHRVGLLFALALYVPIVLFRAFGTWAHWPVGKATLAVAGLELLLLLAATLLWVDRGAGLGSRVA